MRPKKRPSFILGVDFAANASSKAIKEDISLSAAITAVSLSGGSSITSNGQKVTFKYNGTYSLNKTPDTSRPGTQGNNTGMNGSVQSVTLQPGVYRLTAWGAEGGKGCEGVTGGKGGKVVGTYTVTGNAPITVYVAVGGRGSDNYRNEVVAADKYNRSGAKGGGWNGGGGVLSTGSGTGGGATHFALSLQGDGQLKNYKTYGTSMIANLNQYEPTGVIADHSGDVLMVAGGGGGGEHGVANVGTGNGGGLTGAEGRYFTTGGWNNNKACHGLGGTQSAGGGHRQGTGTTHIHYPEGSTTAATQEQGSTSWKTHPSNGYFGQGGVGTGNNWGGGAGGGGWYGGGGSFVYGGGGGSSYTKANVITDVTHTQGEHTGHGEATIEFLRNVPTQSSMPTITVNRHESKTFTFVGTSNTNSLLGTHPDNLAVSASATNVYQVDGLTDAISQATLLGYNFTDAQKADAATNSWLSYSFTANGVSLKATRYWTGTKQFYVKVKDTNNALNWFRFNAKVEGGELKKDATPSGDFKFGKSTTQVPTEGEITTGIVDSIILSHAPLFRHPEGNGA